VRRIDKPEGDCVPVERCTEKVTGERIYAGLAPEARVRLVGVAVMVTGIVLQWAAL
jgi:hypothetical protein